MRSLVASIEPVIGAGHMLDVHCDKPHQGLLERVMLPVQISDEQLGPLPAIVSVHKVGQVSGQLLLHFSVVCHLIDF